MLDYSVPIPQEYWNKPEQNGTLVDDTFGGKALKVYIPYGYDKTKCYDVFYFKMGTNNTADQFWTFSGFTSHFEYVIDNLIQRGEIRPTIVVAIQGNAPGQSWLQDNAYGLICYIEGKYRSYAEGNAEKIIESAKHRAVGGWSLGSIECRGILVDDRHNQFWKAFGWFDIQSGYNAAGMGAIDSAPFVGCAAGTADDGGCIKFTTTSAAAFASNPKLAKNRAQVVKGYSHMIKYQLAYFYNAIKYFFGNN